MNKNQEFLKHADYALNNQVTQRNMLQARIAQAPETHVEILERDLAKMEKEILRLTQIRESVLDTLTAEEIEEYSDFLTPVISEAQQRRDRDDAVRAMNENKDSNSI